MSPFVLPLFSSDSCHRQRTSPFLAPFYIISFLEMNWGRKTWPYFIPSFQLAHPAAASPRLSLALLHCQNIMLSRISYPERDCRAKKWLKWLFLSQTVISDPAFRLGARLPKVTIHFSMHRDQYMLKPVPRFALRPLPVLYFTVKSQKHFSSLPRWRRMNGKTKNHSCLYTCSPQEGIVFGLCSVFFYFSFFSMNLHGVMFALAGVVSGQWLVHYQGSG